MFLLYLNKRRFLSWIFEMLGIGLTNILINKIMYLTPPSCFLDFRSQWLEIRFSFEKKYEMQHLGCERTHRINNLTPILNEEEIYWKMNIWCMFFFLSLGKDSFFFFFFWHFNEKKYCKIILSHFIFGQVNHLSLLG